MRICKKCNENERAPGRSLCYSCYGKKRRGEPKPNYTTPSDMKMLFIDIETRPNLVWTWGLFKQNIGINQIVKPCDMMCFAAKWYGDDETMFFADWNGDRLSMVQAAWTLLDEADVICHYYGSQFDVKHLNREFLLNGFPPPRPFKQIDLKFVASKTFKFTSNKLQFVSTLLGMEGKEEHEGFPLWSKVMDGDADAQMRMQSYNEQDVILLEECFEVLIPWIPNLPNRWLYDGHSGCPGCGASQMLQPAGFAYTKVSKFKQYRCDNCGAYFRDGKRIEGVSLQESVR